MQVQLRVQRDGVIFHVLLGHGRLKVLRRGRISPAPLVPEDSDAVLVHENASNDGHDKAHDEDENGDEEARRGRRACRYATARSGQIKDVASGTSSPRGNWANTHAV